MLIGGIGLIEAFRLTGDERWARAADDLTALLDDTAALFADYVFSPSIDVEPYGPTAVTGIIAAELLRYVEVVDPLDTERVDAALRIAAAVDRNAWDDAGGFYRARPADDRLDLYPNVAMMIVWTLAHRMTGDPGHLARAEALFDAIQPLRLGLLGAYHSLYSSTVPDYVSLSSQNYLVFGLRFLDEETANPRYAAEAATILDFVTTRLYSNGMAWHHWESDARASWYCTGCNFQLLYDLWLLGADPQGPLANSLPFRPPIHPGRWRCSSLTYVRVCSLLAPCRPGASSAGAGILFARGPYGTTSNSLSRIMSSMRRHMS